MHLRTFEPIVSRDHQKRIAEAFADRATGEEDVDVALLAIRRSLEVEHGGPADFYRSPLREQWLTGERRASLVRGANVDGVNAVPIWLDGGYCSIGWSEVGDIPEGIGRSEVVAAMAAASPGSSAAETAV